MLLFGTKVEKALSKCKKKDMELIARYVDGNAGHKVGLVRFDRNKLVITGFAESLREDNLEISIPELQLAITSKVTHTSHDIKGQILYHLPLPEDPEPMRPREDRFFVYPHGMVVLAPEDEGTDDQILSSDLNAGDAIKGLKMYLWDIGKLGFEAVNSGKFHYAVGSTYSGKLRVGKVEDLFSAEVTNLQSRPFHKETVTIVGFKLKSAPRGMDKILEMAAKIDLL